METKREREALFALEMIKDIKDAVRLDVYQLGAIIDIALDKIYDKPNVEEETPELMLGKNEFPGMEGEE